MNSAESMTGDAALLAAYEQWRRLAEQEAEAIRTRDWTLMANCQKQLQELQSQIIRLTDKAREEWKRTNADQMAKEKHLRTIISSLIELELRNSSLLTAAREIAHAQLSQLDIASQNLKRIQRSYAPLRQAAWSSFS